MYRKYRSLARLLGVVAALLGIVKAVVVIFSLTATTPQTGSGLRVDVVVYVLTSNARPLPEEAGEREASKKCDDIEAVWCRSR